MITYQNRLLSLNYLEDTEILLVSWSDSDPYDAVELQESFDKVIETIINYHCRKLLIDASEAVMEIDDNAIQAAFVNFAIQLGKTGIVKVARIITSNHSREARIQYIRDKVSLPFQIYDISNREQALKWLKED